jgi:hypothetical protein
MSSSAARGMTRQLGRDFESLGLAARCERGTARGPKGGEIKIKI